jgi:quinohemoprotein ethanol dehydrogenase
MIAGLRRFCLTAGLLAASLVAAPIVGMTMPAGDWPGYAGHDEAHYSPLDQINEANVGRLGLAWATDTTGVTNMFTAPIAVDGVLYLALGHAVVHAVDGRTGKLLWRYDPEVGKVAGTKLRGGWGSRGMANAGGRLFVGTVDGRLIAIDAKSGRKLWSVETTAPDDGRIITGAPWVFDGKVVIGHGGADMNPVRGYVTAYDQKTGRQLWRFFTVPGDPAKGFENKAMAMAAKTWTGEWWRWGGGGTVWNAMAYDARFHRLYIGVGNGAPWNQKIRSPGGGDNLFLCSIVALDADTGEYVWHYQLNPGETWDYNASMDIELADLPIGGKLRPVLLHAPKNGFFYVIDRETGKLLSAEKFATNVSWADRIDLASGRPVENPKARFPNGESFGLFPDNMGAHGPEAMAYSPKTKLVYLPIAEGGFLMRDPSPLAAWRYTPGMGINPSVQLADDPSRGPRSNRLTAWDPVAQKPVWSVPRAGLRAGGVTATGGNLVIQGDVSGTLAIYSARTGAKLWSFDAHTGIMAQPVSFLAGGRQYISVTTGWRGNAPSGWTPEWDFTSQKRRILTFALDGKARLPKDDLTPPPFADDPAFKLDPATVASGAALYGVRCGICHGPEAAAAALAPDLRRSQLPLSVEAFDAVVRQGALTANGMPRFEELSADDLEAIRHYLRSRARLAMGRN